MNDRNNKKLNSLIAILLFVFGILLLTIIILNLPYNENIIGNIVTIFAGVVGGALTLIGVLMEIKHQEKVRKEEKLEKDNEKKMEYKPLFTIVNYLTTSRGNNLRNFVIKHDKCYNYSSLKEYKLNDNERFYRVNAILLQNSDNSNFILKSILIDGVKINNKEKVLINKNDNIVIRNFEYILSSNENFPQICMEVEDVLGNDYYYKIVLDREEDNLIAIDAIEVKNIN